MKSSPEFLDRFVRTLPGDPSNHPGVRQVLGACYSRVLPTPVREPRLLAWSDEVADLLGVRFDADWLAALSGNRLLPGMQPYAACYGGHQFGQWAGQLGDGRAITLGEWQAPDQRIWELQLKGAGMTPYSRRADGRAVLRSSLREYLCSEAMHALGVPTTRALSLIATGDSVVRDMLYDGNPKAEPGAIVCRVATSFVRFGNFEIFASRDDTDTLRHLANHVIQTCFPELGPPGPDAYAAWFETICRRTGLLMAHWMRVGFVHGVMNTDNLSILGLTIDYGPYGWLEDYDPNWTPNTTDAGGRRYAYGNQPAIAEWNLGMLARALWPLLDDAQALENGLATYGEAFNRGHSEMLAAKLGLAALGHPGDKALISGLFTLLGRQETDYTLFFRQLARVDLTQAEPQRSQPLQVAYYAPISAQTQPALIDWLDLYAARIRADSIPPEARQPRMDRANPRFVARNYLAQQAIDAATQGDMSVLERLTRVLKRPYDEQPEHADLAAKRPEWARHKAGCSMLSCSS